MLILARPVVNTSPNEFQAIIWVVAFVGILVSGYQAYVKPARRGERPVHLWFALAVIWAVGSAVAATYLGFCFIFLPALPALAVLKE
jgi:hypothetical protein